MTQVLQLKTEHGTHAVLVVHFLERQDLAFFFSFSRTKVIVDNHKTILLKDFKKGLSNFTPPKSLAQITYDWHWNNRSS